MKVIEVKNLRHIIDGQIIIDDLSFSIKKGEYVSILGHNGSGKSTIAAFIAGITEYETDSIITNEKIGLILENPDNQIIGTTVDEDIAFGLQNQMMSRDEMNKKIDYSLDKMNILHLKERDINSLSGGQKQKVAIASLIALDYQTYIFDEATSMLDPSSKELVLSVMKQLHEEGKTIIQITHFMDEVSQSERVLILKNGKLSYDGKPSAIFTNKKLLKENNLI